MRKTLLMTTGLAWLALTGAAGAVTVTLTPGPADPDYFASIPVGESDFSVGTTLWSGTGKTEQGSLQGQYAAPLGDTNVYMAVQNGKTETVTFATPQNSIRIYWGSIDAMNVDGILNQVSVTVDGYTLTGSDLVALGANGKGNQGTPADNEWVSITGLQAFTTVAFSDSGKNAFEFSLGAPVPEPATWAMMTLGFVGLGYAAFRRNTKGRALAI
jgi:PEP-CTERM motif